MWRGRSTSASPRSPKGVNMTLGQTFAQPTTAAWWNSHCAVAFCWCHMPLAMPVCLQVILVLKPGSECQLPRVGGTLVTNWVQLHGCNTGILIVPVGWYKHCLWTSLHSLALISKMSLGTIGSRINSWLCVASVLGCVINKPIVHTGQISSHPNGWCTLAATTNLQFSNSGHHDLLWLVLCCRMQQRTSLS